MFKAKILVVGPCEVRAKIGQDIINFGIFCVQTSLNLVTVQTNFVSSTGWFQFS